MQKDNIFQQKCPLQIFFYNNYLGMKRGQSPVVPFFRGGEGDGTFNGFVLSSVYGINYINIKLKTPQLDFYDALQFILPMMAF